jgi:uncharacterized protein YlzI (FlbEa/FlbD family)
MPKFIKVTARHGDLIYHINVGRIESVFAVGEENRIVLNGSYDQYSYYIVKETVEEIMEMING